MTKVPTQDDLYQFIIRVEKRLDAIERQLANISEPSAVTPLETEQSSDKE